MSILDEWLVDASQRASEIGRPLVTLSYAQSLDGCLTVQRGRPTALSGPESMRLTHAARAAHQAILVGVGTVLADDPQLTVRLAPGKNPQVVILDSRLRTPLTSRLMQRSGQMPWLVSGTQIPNAQREVYQALGARLIPCDHGENGMLSLPLVLQKLYALGVERLMVEGGAQVITSFLEHRLVDQVMLTVAPVWLGGLAAVERRGELAAETCGKLGVAGVKNPVYEQHGRDLVVWGRVTEVDV